MKKTNQKSSASSGTAKDRQSSGGKSKRGGPRGDSAAPDADTIVTLWPEWSDNDILAEKWAEKDKSGKHIAVFEDPEPLVELPRSLKGLVAAWKRPSEYITEQAPIVVDPQRYDPSAWTNSSGLGAQLSVPPAPVPVPAPAPAVSASAHLPSLTQSTQSSLHQSISAEKPQVVAPSANPSEVSVGDADASGRLENVDDMARISTGSAAAAYTSELMRTFAAQLSILLDPRLGVGSERFRPWELLYPRGKDGVPYYNAGGKYSVRLFWMGTWRRITIDDRMPFDADGNILLPTSSVPNEIWVPLICKALLRIAALSYQETSSEPEHGDFSIVHALTGALPECIPIHQAAVAQRGDLWGVVCNAWRPVDSREDGDDDDANGPDSRPETPPNESEGAGSRQAAQSQSVSASAAPRPSQGSAGPAPPGPRAQSGTQNVHGGRGGAPQSSTTLRKQTSVSSVSGGHPGPHSAGASKLATLPSATTAPAAEAQDVESLSFERLVLATIAPLRPAYQPLATANVAALAALGAVPSFSGAAPNNAVSNAGLASVSSVTPSATTASSMNLTVPPTQAPTPSPAQQTTDGLWSRADLSHTALVYEMRSVSVSLSTATALGVNLSEVRDGKVDLKLVWLISSFAHWRGRLSYSDVAGWTPELEAALGVSRETRLNRQKAVSALRDAGKPHAPFEYWMLFADFLEAVRGVAFHHLPSAFEQTDSVSYVHESIVATTDSTPNPSLALRIPFLLHVDNESPAEILVGFTAFSGPKANSALAGPNPPAGMLVVDSYNWQSMRSDVSVFKIKTNATKAAVLSVPAGPHVYRFSVTAPFGYWITVCSRHTFSFGEEGLILRERLGAFVSDYEGTHDEQAANGWFLLFQQVFNFSQPTFVRATLYSPLQFSGPRLDESISSHSQLRIIDNDSLKEVPKVFLQPVPKLLEPNTRGYTFMGDGRCPQAIAPGRWRLRIVSSPAPPIPLLPEVATKFHQLDFDGAYVHNKHSTLFRFTVKIEADHPVTIQLGTSQPAVYIKLQVLDNNEEIASATGRSHALIPAFVFQADPRSDSRADGDAKEKEKEKEKDKHAVVNSSNAMLNEAKDDDADSVISENIKEYRPHKYIIQATIERKSWPLPGMTRTLSMWDNLQAATANTPQTPGGKEGSGPPDKKLSVSGSADKPTGRARAKSAARAGSPFKVPDIPAYSENDLVWRLRILSVADTAKLEVKKDTEREDQIRAIKAAWETSQPGRAAKARTSRDQYLLQLAERDPAKAAEMSDEVPSGDRTHHKHETLDKYMRRAGNHVPRVLSPAEEKARDEARALCVQQYKQERDCVRAQRDADRKFRNKFKESLIDVAETYVTELADNRTQLNSVRATCRQRLIEERDLKCPPPQPAPEVVEEDPSAAKNKRKRFVSP